MATVQTVDVTTKEGASTLPLNTNDVMGLVETLASQNIRSVKSANKLEDAVYNYEIEDGKVIEEAVIEMAQAQAFSKVPQFKVEDPTVHPKYFNNYETKQFLATVRRDDVRAIIANKGVGVENVVASILDTLTQGESNYDFEETRKLLYGASFKDYSSVVLDDKKPLNMRGVIYCLRDMYNHLKSNNSDLTESAYISSVVEDDIRIALSTKLLNLMDVAELAHIFNLSKEELFGKIVVVDVDDLADHTNDYVAYVYDRKALGRATRIYDYTQDIYGNARCTTHYLTVERAYFHNGLFKGAKLDCTKACETALATLIGEVQE